MTIFMKIVSRQISAASAGFFDRDAGLGAVPARQFLPAQGAHASRRA
jgi:hypothetical protein